MPGKIVVLLLGCLLAVTGCNKPSSGQPSVADTHAASPVPSQAKIAACSLLTRAEIEAVQGSPITDEKSSDHSDQGLSASQCYYLAKQANLSVSLSVTQNAGGQSIKDYWKDTFEERDHGGEARGGEEEGERVPPKKIEGVGDAAYWVGNRVGGTLYVLKNSAFIRLSLGGPDKEQTKIDKSKALAEKAVAHL